MDGLKKRDDTTDQEPQAPPNPEDMSQALQGSGSTSQEKPPVGFSQEEWESLPDTTREIIRKRMKGMDKYFTQKSQELTQKEKELERMLERLNKGLKEIEEKTSKVSKSDEDIPSLVELGEKANDPIEFQKWLTRYMERYVGQVSQQVFEKVEKMFENKFGEISQVQKKQMADQVWQNFCTLHPDAPNYEKDMVPFLLRGMTLEEAYNEAKSYREFKQRKSSPPSLEEPGILASSSSNESEEVKSIEDAFKAAYLELKKKGIEI